MKRTVLAALAALLLLLLTTLGASAEGTTYQMTVDLDVARARLDVQQRVHVLNETGGPLGSLALSVTPAYFGAFSLDSATVDGQAVAASLDGTIMRIQLPAPLPAGNATDLDLTYTIDVPSPGSLRFGSASGIVALGNWYPILFPHRGGNWLTHQYTPVGDAFVTEVADYDVTIRPTTPVVAAHTGRVISRDGNNFRVSALGVRSFGLAFSTRYETASRKVDGVEITAYYLPEHRAGAREYLDTGAEFLAWANERLGRYPYSTLAIAETAAEDPNEVGQEIPGLIFISTGVTRQGGDMGSYLSYLVAHEVAHQWFYALVGNDQVREPWLDEAFSTYLPERFYADRYPGIFASRWATFESRLASETARLGRRPVDTGIFDFQDEGIYFAVVYRRGAAFLDELRVTLGDAVFWQLVRDFVSTYSDRIARGTDFLTMAQTRSADDLTPLMSRYFQRVPANRGGPDFPVENGHFYTQTNGGQAGTGFAVVDDANARFWTEFQRLGGVAALGYPASRRFTWEGFTVQVFQKAILQWRPEIGQAYFVNVLDRLSAAGKDDWLLSARMTPRPDDTAADAGLAWDAVVERHQLLLEADPAIRAAYFAVDDSVARFGLPMNAADMGNAYVIRCQRAVFQRWKEDVPWARAGQVTIANGGDLAKEAGILPAEALAPMPAP